MKNLESNPAYSIHNVLFRTLETAMKHRSSESGMHIKRTTEFVRMLIENIKSSLKSDNQLLPFDYESIIQVSALHDIGKIGIPGYVLLKPGKLTEDEYETMKTHVTIGYDIVSTISSNTESDDKILSYCKDIVLYHHERWDGTGYPSQLSGEEIPFAARIVSVVDVYDALVNERCYKAAYSHEKAVEIIENGRGTQFDPAIVDLFLMAAPEFKMITQQLQAI